MPLWETLDSSRYASGTLFAADIALSLLGRDFGHTVFSDPPIAVATGSTFDAWTDLTSVWVAFPESWGLDLTYPAFPRISLPVRASLSGLEWDLVSPFLLRLTADGDEIEVPSSTTDQDVTLTLDYTGTLPTGVTELKIQYYISPGGTVATCNVKRPRGTLGPNAWIGYVQP